MSIDDLYSGRHVTELSIAVFWRWISFAVKVLIHWWLWNDAQSLKWHGRGALLFFRPPPLGSGGIMFSGCPSIRPRSEIPYFYLYIGPLVHPTIRDRFAACPSVRRDFRAFAGECMEGINGLKFGMLMYLGHLQNWLVYGHSLLIFSCDQAALQMVFSVRLSVRPSVRLSVCHTFLTMFPSSYHHEIFRSYY